MKKFLLAVLILSGVTFFLVLLAREGLPLLSILHKIHHYFTQTKRNKPRYLSLLEPMQSSVGTIGKVDSLKVQEFRRSLGEILGSLPSVSKVRAGANDLSYPPPEFSRLSAQLGSIAEAVKTNPELLSEALAFYDDCARRADTFTAVRAVCLSNLRQGAKKSGHPELVDDFAYPAKVREIAQFLQSH